jgi:hypothetical protein
LAYGAGIPHSYVKLAIVGVREFELSDTFLMGILMIVIGMMLAIDLALGAAGLSVF